METGELSSYYHYICNVSGCEDWQDKYCGYSFVCPFCGEGVMQFEFQEED